MIQSGLNPSAMTLRLVYVTDGAPLTVWNAFQEFYLDSLGQAASHHMHGLNIQGIPAPRCLCLTKH